MERAGVGPRQRIPLLAVTRRTMLASNCSIVSPGALHLPVCTAEVWIIVLRGATSQ